MPSERNESHLSPVAAKRQLTYRYAIALVLIAALATTAFTTLIVSLKHEEASAVVINVAGRQRMLSQRIAFFLNQPTNTPEQTSALDQARAAIALFETSHAGLTQGSTEMGLPASLNDEARQIYFGAPALDQKVTSYIATARQILLLRDNAAEVPPALMARLNEQAAGQLLALLNDAVTAFERQSVAAVQRLKVIEQIVYITTLLLLLIEALFIFRPAIRSVYHSMRQTAATQARFERAAADRKLVLDTVSHELKTPLNQLHHALSGIGSNALDFEQQNALVNASEAADDISESVRAILSYVSIDSADAILRPEPVNIAALVSEAIDREAPKAKEKGLLLSTAEMPPIDGSTPELMLDKSLISSILNCLLKNAVFYTDEGRIHVDYAYAQKDQHDGILRIRVHDTGSGIAPEKMDTLFAPFHGSARDGGAVRGLGLGLAYAQRAANRMDGDIKVQSTVGEGSTFTVTVAASVAKPIESSATQEISAAWKPCCLVAEDNPVNQIVLTKFLQDNGFAVTTVSNGREAVKAALEQKFDAILLDILMPEMRGDEACRRIRDELRADCPLLIAVTANDLPEDIAGYLAAGFDSVVSKPIAAHQLRAALSDIPTERSAQS